MYEEQLHRKAAEKVAREATMKAAEEAQVRSVSVVQEIFKLASTI